MIYLYNLLLLLLFVPALILVAARYRKKIASEFFFKAGERLGFWNPLPLANDGKPLIWVHCASLGEVKAVEPILKKLDRFTILITTVTLSGRQYALDSHAGDYVYFVPLDLSFIVAGVFKKTGAKALLLVETELWPGLIQAAHSRGAKIFLVNARLSPRSYSAYKTFKAFWKPFLRKIDALCARAPEDAERFLALGYPEERAVVTGNIKYDKEETRTPPSREELGFNPSDLIWVCGSTRKGENEILVNVWLQTRKSRTGLKLVIAPRHTGRAGEIIRLLDPAGIDYALRSALGKNNFDCLIVDTFGELWKYYSVCDFAFVGGSLVQKGGQNPIEPAAFSKPVIFGSHMDNFLSEARVLSSTGGGIMVKNAVELKAAVEQFSDDGNLRSQTGKKAYEAVQGQKGAVAKTVDIINSIMAEK